MSKESPQAEKISSKKIFPVVGIGASAGGLDAFKKFIKAIPPGSGMAYILVQHLHPDHTSALPEILQRETSIPVIEVSDNVEVAPDTVYIIPVNKMLVAKDGILQLSPRPSDKKNRLIDVFFSSLAEVHHSQAIGIVLSGTGTDGTDGLKKIKDEGGITMAQDKASAAYDDMPESAIQSEVVDFIMPPEEMPQRLLDLAKTYNRFDEEGHPPADEKNEEAAYRQILSILRISFAADFNFYKQTTIRRRIMRRMAILRLEKIAGYLKFIRQNKDEQSTLFQDLLIPVTAFFRDPGTFEYITETVFPQLIKNKSFVNPLRIWVAGCSTGEEAYSLGMCLYEFLSNITTSVKVQIFATDVSEFSIAKARGGVYNKRQLENVSEERLQQFFTKTDGHYQIKKIIRDMCVFASHNFLKDPPFARIDLISCRNVLIYMEPFLQKKAFSIFHYALNEKGFLLLGKSETPGASSELFEPFGKKDKLYTKKEAIGSFQGIPSRAKEEFLKDKDYAVQSNARKQDDFQKSADDILLSKYTPAGVIVNSQFDIVQFRGSTGPYLEPSPGKASLNILKMARYGLAFELRNALHKAKTLRKTVVKERIPLDDGKKIITIEVIPLLNTIDAHYLILFKNFDDTDLNNPQARAKNKKQVADDLKDAKNARIVQLEKDLALAREDMRTITEDQEAANEELQSANEELLSGSEELQSLNEELETSKEELQSTNEELVTVNQELFDRNEGYNQARLYAEAIVTAIHEPLLVLQNNFNVKSANHSFYNNFNITEKEVLGKNLFELKNNFFDIPGLQKEISKLRQEKVNFIDWEVTHVFPGLGKKTICFNIQPITGQPLILLAMDDITLRKESEKAQGIFNLRKILEFMPQIALSASAEGMFNYFNNYFVDYTGSVMDEVKGTKWLPDIHPDQSKKAYKAWRHSVETLENFNYEFQLKRKSDGMYRWHVCRATAIINENGVVESWVGTITDIEDQVAKEKAKDEFIATASHELRTPLTSATVFLQLLEHSMKQNNNPDLVYAQKAAASLKKLNYLVSELLDANKIKQGKMGLNITSFNFNEMLSQAIEIAQISAPNHIIMLSRKINRKIKGDRERLQQVVINLLSNAVKYSPGAEKVFVHATVEKGNLKVSVKDEGVGINKKNLNKIFERYYREEEQDKRFSGLGIGLSICKDIIQKHNGKIWVESEPGKGSTFYFIIPL